MAEKHIRKAKSSALAPHDIPRATHEGTLEFGDIVVPCYVLADGTALITKRGALSALTGGAPKRNDFGRYIDKIPNRPEEFSARPIFFRTPRGSLAHGLSAEAFVDIAQLYVDAMHEGRLRLNQRHIGEQCYRIIRALAKVGIVALIYEKTGYKTDHARRALHKILEAYIAPELMPWTKRFPDEFYAQLFRLWGWSYDPASPHRPIRVGLLTNMLVYDRLPAGVLDELRAKNPPGERGRRRHRHHQFLSPDVGHPHLERHLLQLVALMRAAESWDQFLVFFARAFPERAAPVLPEPSAGELPPTVH